MDNLNPQQIQQMIQLLQSMLPNVTEESAPDSQPKKKKTRTPKAQTKSKESRPANERTNKFDLMAESRMHKEDVEIDRKLIVQPPVPRARKFNLINVVCRVCGKREEVNPVLITDSLDRYKCNRCSGASG